MNIICPNFEQPFCRFWRGLENKAKSPYNDLIFIFNLPSYTKWLYNTRPYKTITESQNILRIFGIHINPK